MPDYKPNSITVSYKSYKSRRVARSVLSTEVVTFVDLFDNELVISKNLEFLLRQPILLHILTDPKSLFEIISKGSRTNGKLIMLYMYAVRKEFKAQ